MQQYEFDVEYKKVCDELKRIGNDPKASLEVVNLYRNKANSLVRKYPRYYKDYRRRLYGNQKR